MLPILETKGLFEKGVGEIGVVVDWRFGVYVYMKSEGLFKF